MSLDASNLALLFDGLLSAQAQPDFVGPFGLWPSAAPWPNPVRPLAGTHVSAADVDALVAALADRGTNPGIEWVLQEHPELEELLRARGAEIVRTPALALDLAAVVEPPALASGFHVFQQHADDSSQDLLSARVVGDLSFGNPGVAVGTVGDAERDAKVALDLETDAGRAFVAYSRERLASPDFAMFVIAGPGGMVARAAVLSGAAGTEIAGVATLPAYRRNGLAAVLTHTAIVHARDSGKLPVVLAAADEDVARIYERVGFVRVATTCEAELPAASGAEAD